MFYKSRSVEGCKNFGNVRMTATISGIRSEAPKFLPEIFLLAKATIAGHSKVKMVSAKCIADFAEVLSGQSEF